ncbi:hypothetical protein H5410_003401 [Solanum commersonii]|uniref:Uncharacterized protein n=1 Tax=Solanum commersonii TaxID=4109 RepID=A0A9J6B506_SOLCO|nr:hypothetical protein H5410_003401 [Solanum commersonii]
MYFFHRILNSLDYEMVRRDTSKSQVDELSPFKQIARQLHMKKGLISKSEAIVIYMEEVKRDLMENLDIDIRDDISTVSASHTNIYDESCMAGKAQSANSNEEIDIDALLKRLQEQVEESSSNTNCKGKGKVPSNVQRIFGLYAKQGKDNVPPSYSAVLADEKSTEVFDQNNKNEVILFQEHSDLRWKNDPWQLMSRKRVLTPQEWGMSPLKERDYMHPEQKIAVKYNYWDYVNSFNKALLYENANRKHSWFIKICSHVFDQPIPNWFSKWRTLYGPSVKKLFEPYKKLYSKWVDISPKLISLEQDNIYSLKRTFHTKFWNKLIQKDPEEKIHGQEIRDLINITMIKYHNTDTSKP